MEGSKTNDRLSVYGDTSIKTEFKCSMFGFNYHLPHLLASNQWGFSPTGYMQWRIAWAFYHVFCFLYLVIDKAVINPSLPPVWFFYMSIWGYLLLTVNTTVQATVATYAIFNEYPNDGGTPCHLKFTWLLYTLSTELSLEVTILYLSCGCNGKMSLPTALTHVATSVYVLIDMVVTATPIRLLHFIYPVVLKCLYIMASAMFLAAEGTNERDEKYAYSPFDWVYDRGFAKLALAWTLGGAPVLHLLVWTLYLFRKWVHARINNLGKINGSAERSIKNTDVHG